MRFIRTDRGQYVAISAIERVEKEPLERPAGKSDDGIRKFSFYNADDDLIGSIRVREDRLEFLLAEYISAQPGEKIITLHYDDEERTVWHQEHRVIAWAILPSSDWPQPILNSDQSFINGPGVSVLIERPDGKLDDVFTGEYASLEDAKSDFLKRCLPEAAE